MAKKNRAKSWDDPRHIRPEGWIPPRTTEGEYSRLFASFEGGQKKVLVAGHLSSLAGEAQFAYWCHLFYTDNLSPLIILGNYWSPWRDPEQMQSIIRGLLPHVEADIREFCQIWLIHTQSLENLNQKWGSALAKFFNLPIPQNEKDFQALRDHVELYRKENGAAWVSLPEFQSLVSDLDRTVTRMQELLPKLNELLHYTYSQVSPDDLQALTGNQKVKDRIETSRNEPSHKRAINMLNRALKNNLTEIQSSEIYKELGFRYSELGEITQALESYTKSIDLGKLPDPLVYFWRGELYCRQKEWKKAIKDFEQAITLGIYTPEREQALQYISECRLNDPSS